MIYSKNNAAKRPPMGWNSWDCFGAMVNETQLLENAEYMAKHMKDFGWEYIVCDIQWSEPDSVFGDYGTYRPFTKLVLDEYGRQQPAPTRFPSGFRAIADKIHGMGLKFGIHIMRGVPRQAVHDRLPVYGLEGVTCDKIAKIDSVCRWNSDMYGVKDNAWGQTYYDSLFAQYAAWGVDYVKVDDICNTNAYPCDPYSAEKEIEMIAHAIKKCGRQMVLSLSPGPAVIEKSWHLSEYANMWRITDDFWDEWPLLKNMFWRCELWQDHVKEGCWPDCDMLPLGRIGIGFDNARQTRFTKEEQITHMTLWSIFRSPLMMGGNLPDNDAFTLSLLTNRDALRVNQTGGSPRQILRDDEKAAWHNTDDAGNEYIALFNLSDIEKEISVPENRWQTQPAQVKEVWGRDALVTGKASATLPPHGAVLLMAQKESI